jgi:glutathione S-transferase
MLRQIPKYFSTATSVAAKTVDRHAATAELILWAGWFCPFTQRSWIVLEELDVSYQYKEVNPYLKEPSFLSEFTFIFVPCSVKQKLMI